MATDMEQGVKKTLSLSKETAQMTSDVLKDMMKTFLSGNATKSGRVSMREMRKQAAEHGGKLESIEISNKNIGDFLSVAKKYDIDFACKHDSGSGVYHVIFEARNTEDFKRAFTEYASDKQKKIAHAVEQPVTTRQQFRQMAQKIQQEEPKKKEKVREKSKNMSL